MIWPKTNRRKFLWRRARKVDGGHRAPLVSAVFSDLIPGSETREVLSRLSSQCSRPNFRITVKQQDFKLRWGRRLAFYCGLVPVECSQPHTQNCFLDVEGCCATPNECSTNQNGFHKTNPGIFNGTFGATLERPRHQAILSFVTSFLSVCPTGLCKKRGVFLR